MKHDLFKNEYEKYELIYKDNRKFGFIKKINKKKVFSNIHLAKLGCEPLSSKFCPKYLKQKIFNKKSSIKNLLMNQSIVAGLGNIYVNEVLYLIRINPQKRVLLTITKIGK